MRRLIAFLLTLFLLAACSTPPPATEQVQPTADEGESTVVPDEPEETAVPEPTATSEPTPTPPYSGDGPWDVEFETEDGTDLSGMLYGPPSTTALVLVPMYPGQQAGWAPFAEAAAEEGYRALTFDLRGYGSSGGELDLGEGTADIAAAVDFLRSETGAEDVILMGAVQGGMEAIRYVADGGEHAVGLAVLSTPRSVPDLEVTDSDLRALDVPSLWIGSRQDMLQDVEAMHELAGSDDKEVWIYEGIGVQGTYLFESIDAPDLQRRLLEFANRVSGQ